MLIVPSVTLTEIQDAVIDVAEAAKNVILPLKLQDKDFKDNDKPYVELIIAPNEVTQETLSSDLLNGFIVFNVYVQRDYGTRWPAAEAQKCIDLFPFNSVHGPIRIAKTSSPRTAFDNGDGWRVTPALIPYEASSCRH